MILPTQAPPGREWVDTIRDPRQKVLALAIPILCGFCGITPEDLWRPLGDRRPRPDLTAVCLGSIICLGREMSLQWAELQGPQSFGPTMSGHTEILDLVHGHRQCNLLALDRYNRFLARGLLGTTLDNAVDAVRQELIPLWQRWHRENLERQLTKKLHP